MIIQGQCQFLPRSAGGGLGQVCGRSGLGDQIHNKGPFFSLYFLQFRTEGNPWCRPGTHPTQSWSHQQSDAVAGRVRGLGVKRYGHRGWVRSSYLSQYCSPCLTATVTPRWSMRSVDKEGGVCVSSAKDWGLWLLQDGCRGRGVCPRVPVEQALQWLAQCCWPSPRPHVSLAGPSIPPCHHICTSNTWSTTWSTQWPSQHLCVSWSHIYI